MRTDCCSGRHQMSVPWSPSKERGGGGLCPERGLSPGGPHPRGREDGDPPVNRMTHASENITFPCGRYYEWAIITDRYFSDETRNSNNVTQANKHHVITNYNCFPTSPPNPTTGR